MLVIPPDTPLPQELRGAVVAIGNFDGAHFGHQYLFELARRCARDHEVPFIILTFDPHPRAFFRPDGPSFLLTPPPLRFERLALSGADACVVVRFDRAMADHTPQAFMDEVLRDTLSASHIFVGHDFHFGHDRAGTVQTLRAGGFAVTALDLLRDIDEQPYSSTRVRGFLADGDLANANRLLGWEWEIVGTVEHGDKRGRELGYPTANIPLGSTFCPAHGIYAAWVQTADQVWHRAALSLGMRPMFAVTAPLLEAFLLDFSGDLYGQALRVRPVARLREEMAFSDLSLLVRQIERDVEQVRRVLP